MPPPTPRTVALIGNPVSGRGRGAAAMDAAAAWLRTRGIEARVLPTEQPGQARDLAASAEVATADLLLVAGGDGTLRDAAAGLDAAGLHRIPVGLIPAGTGNDLVRTLGIPMDLPRALETALSGSERSLDLWRWNDPVFVNVAGVGLDADVAATANRRFRRLRGTLAYLGAFFLTLPAARPFSLSLTWEAGEWSGKAWLAAFGSGRCYGGGMRIAPAAEPDDGLLDLVVIEGLPKLELLLQFPHIFRGTHVRHPRVRSFRAARLRVEAPPRDVTLDGELIARTPAVVTPAEGKLRVRVRSSGHQVTRSLSLTGARR